MRDRRYREGLQLCQRCISKHLRKSWTAESKASCFFCYHQKSSAVGRKRKIGPGMKDIIELGAPIGGRVCEGHLSTVSVVSSKRTRTAAGSGSSKSRITISDLTKELKEKETCVQNLKHAVQEVEADFEAHRKATQIVVLKLEEDIQELETSLAEATEEIRSLKGRLLQAFKHKSQIKASMKLKSRRMLNKQLKGKRELERRLSSEMEQLEKSKTALMNQAELKLSKMKQKYISETRKRAAGKRRRSYTGSVNFKYVCNNIRKEVEQAVQTIDSENRELAAAEVYERLFNSLPGIYKDAITPDRLCARIGHNVKELLRLTKAKRKTAGNKGDEASRQCRSVDAWRVFQVLLSASVSTETSKKKEAVKAYEYYTALEIGKKQYCAAKKRRLRFISGNVENLWNEKAPRKDRFEVKHKDILEKLIKYFNTPSEHLVISPHDPVSLHFNEHKIPVRHHRNKKCNPDFGCEIHARHEYKLDDKNGHADFLRKHPEIDKKVFSIKMFRKKKPYYVKQIGQRSCVCIYHLHASKLCSSYRTEALKHHGPNCACNCNYCATGKCKDHSISRNIDSLGRACMCEYTLHGKPKVACVTRTCEDCPSTFLACPLEDEVKKDSPATLKEISKVTRIVETKGGKVERKFVEERVELVTLSALKVRALSSWVKPKVFTGFRQDTGFLEHRYISRHMSSAFDKYVDNCPQGHAILVSDFGSNLSFRATQQTQGEFFSPCQATLFPIICYYWKGGERIAIAHDIISEDLKHDSKFVQQMLIDLTEFLKQDVEEEYELSFIHVFSDGCREQFKNRHNFAFVSSFHQITGVRMEWCFFCSCHGKGGSDAETSVLHRLARKIERRVDRIGSGKEACELVLFSIEKFF